METHFYSFKVHIYLHKRLDIFAPSNAVLLARSVIARQRIVHCKKDFVKPRLPAKTIIRILFEHNTHFSRICRA